MRKENPLSWVLKEDITDDNKTELFGKLSLYV